MSAKTITVNCGTALNISHAFDFHQDLRKAMESSSKIEIVADKVEKVDTAGIQVLVAFAKELEKVGGDMTWKSPSDALVKAVATLGLSSFVALD